MIPRYVPGTGLHDLLRLLRSSHQSAGAKERVIGALSYDGKLRQATAFESLRKGLYIYFKALKQQTGRGRILVSAQICPIVAAVIRKAGFEVGFVDIATSCPTPSPEQFAHALDSSIVGVLIAPFYGHLQRSWNVLLEKLGDRRLVLDLAQGLGLAAQIAALAHRADALAYSFSLGKGLDTGGGLLLTRERLDVVGMVTCNTLALAQPLIQCIALRCAISVGLYSPLIRRIDRAVEDSDVDWSPSTAYLAADRIFGVWEARLEPFSLEVARARARVEQLQKLLAKCELLRDSELLCNGGSTHLRQVIRLRSSTLRAGVIDRLHRRGIDCASAGEPLPGEYLGGYAASDFPNAAAFHAEAIRLPFLGRLSDHQFDGFKTALESILAERLS